MAIEPDELFFTKDSHFPPPPGLDFEIELNQRNSKMTFIVVVVMVGITFNFVRVKLSRFLFNTANRLRRSKMPSTSRQDNTRSYFDQFIFAA